MDRFSKLHPIFHFLYFIGVFVLTVSVYNPVFILISLIGAISYQLVLKGRLALSSVKLVMGVTAVVSLFNMIFSHYGMDVLFTIGDTEFTLQALVYGFNQGLMLSSMLIWCELFGSVVDSERVIYVFRFAPKIALLFSMILGFIPRFNKKLKDIREAQLGLNGGSPAVSKKERLSEGVSNLSALVTYSLEGSIITADSMSARGYNPRAIRPSRYRINGVDMALIMCTISAIGYVIFAKASDRITFVFEPRTYFKTFDYLAMAVFCLISLLPVIVDLVEDVIWKISYVSN